MAEKIYYSMGEVAEMLDVRQSVIRYWEKEFGMVRPMRNKKGNRLFSPQDVSRLKMIHHLVRERGMKLEGARKALKQMLREGRSAQRETELLERLQRIRAQLLEVREELKNRDGELVSDAFVEEVAERDATDLATPFDHRHVAGDDMAKGVADGVPAGESAGMENACDNVSDNYGVSEGCGSAEGEPDADVGITVASAPGKGRKTVVKIVEEVSEDAVGGNGISKPAPGTPVRRARRKKEDAENKELFAFYEQSLF